jgi:hypothetical protein
MKPITYYLSWPMTDDLATVLTNLSWENKFELSVALGQMALSEKHSKEIWDRVQVLDSIASPAPGPIAPLTPKAIEPPDKNQ